jgi:malate synthase
MDLKEEARTIAEEIAEEAFSLISNKLQEIENRLQEINRKLEIIAIEDVRGINEKFETLSKENDEEITRLIGDIQELRDQINLNKTSQTKTF